MTPPFHIEWSIFSLSGCRPLRPLESHLRGLPELPWSRSYDIILCLSGTFVGGFLRRPEHYSKVIWPTCTKRTEGISAMFSMYFFQFFSCYTAEVYCFFLHWALSLLFYSLSSVVSLYLIVVASAMAFLLYIFWFF